MAQPHQPGASEYHPLETYTLLVLEYLVLILFVSWMVRRMERRMATAP